MFNKPINNIVKEHFKIMRRTAKQKAEKDFKVNILEKIDGLDDFQKLKLCVAEDDRIRLLKNEDKHPYYINNSDDWLLTQFANRYFLLNVDETSEFIQSVYLGDYGSLIFKEIDRLIKKIPKLTYEDFIAGVQCEYLETFEFYYNIEKEDYYEISKWQMNVLLDIVQYDVLNVIRDYQKYCKTIDNPINFITNELSILEEEVLETITDATALKQILSKLYIFKNNDISKYDNDLLLENYPLFFNDENNYRKLNPENLKEPLNNISNDVKNIVSNELTLFYVLDTVLKWMKSIIKGKSLIEPFEYIDLKKKIDEVKEETENEYQKEIDELNDFCFNNEAITSEQKKEYLRAKFEDEIDAYNNIKDKRIFFFLRDENENLLLENLRFSYIINDSLGEVLGELKKAYRILNVSWEISSIFFELFDSKTMYYKKDSGSHLMIHSLMNDMVLDKDDYNVLHSSMDDFFQRFQNDSVPLDIHFINHRNIYIRLFEKCISRLQEILDNAEPSNKVLYIQTRLKELRQRELRFRTISERNEEFEDKEDKFPNLFKEFLSIEAEFIKETVQISPISFLPNQTKSLSLGVEETDSFKTFVSQEKQDYILRLLEDLSITVGGKSVLSTRKKGALRGVVEALREENILSQMGMDKLCKIIAKEIDLELKSKLDFSDISQKFQKDAKQYIKNNPLH
ncbi:hypothetical protein [Tenacibaculum soleae]|uniref:hypothetical protein n=1 Tax=Tenacibaculum soleae TaxID=447689 RepID=UPI0023010B91|nr:hypothetical protein [Tenacibaculum soleae]